MNRHKITQAILALSLVVTQHALAADKLGPHEQQRLNEDFLDAVFAKKGIKAIEELIKKGADVNATYQDKAPLYFAVENDDKKLAELLLKSGADANAKYKGKTPLYVAVEKGYAKLIDLLLAHGANVNTKAVCGNPGGGKTLYCWPLALAIQNKDQKTTKLLVEHGADVHVVKWLEGWNWGSVDSALYIAVLMGDKNIAAFLLAHGAKVSEGHRESGGKAGETPSVNFISPLQAAVSKGNKDMAAFLLKHGADVNAGALLRKAVEKQDKGMVDLLLKHGADVNKASGNKITPLYVAVNKENEELVKLLLKHKANPNISPSFSYTAWEHPAHLTALEHGAPLHLAVKKGNKKIVALLLSYGANPKQKRYTFVGIKRQQITPIQLARRTGKKEILKLLQQGKREQRKEKWQKIVKKK